MDDQPKVLPQTASTFFYDGASMREPVPGTVPIGGLKEDAAFFTGKGADGEFVATMPVTVDEARLERGRQRYAIYCQPCHDAWGDGKGILFQRGNVPTASFHQEKILKLPDGQIFDVITNGAGLMCRITGWPIPPADRWAIVAYVRELEAQAAGERRSRPRGRPAPVREHLPPLVMNRKLLVILGPVAGIVMFIAGRVGSRRSSWATTVPGPLPDSFHDHRPRRKAARELAAERGRRGGEGAGEALRGGGVPAPFR